MDKLYQAIFDTSHFIWIAITVFFLLLIIISTLRRARLIRTACSNLKQANSDLAVRLRPLLTKALIRKGGDEALLCFIVEHLMRRFENRVLPEDARCLLILAPKQTSFSVLSAAIQNKAAIARVFRDWISENPDSVRQLALSSQNREFDGEGAWKLLASRLDDVRELYGDPEWPVRYFALRILLADADRDVRSAHIAREAFEDVHPLLRALAARYFGNGDTENLFPTLLVMALNDPVAELRQIARQRIDSIFPGRWALEPDRIDALQTAHVLELQKIDSKNDENLAISALKKGETFRTTLAAARFLENSGVLERMFINANRGDEVVWERCCKLLSRAISVGVHSFLKRLRTVKTLDVQLLGVRLLNEGGSLESQHVLIKRVFNRRIDCPDERELYKTAINLACSGEEKSQVLLRDELRKHRENPEILNLVLPTLPPNRASVYREPLIEFLRDPHFKSDESFLEIMAKLPPSMFIGPILDILEADRSLYTREVQIRALRTLGVWRLHCTLQTILENLPILPPEKRGDFTIYLKSLNKELLEERVDFILSSQDARLKAALISCLPVDSVGDFAEKISENLSDSDSELRLASLCALANAGKFKTIHHALLKDPVERVRREAARIAGLEGSIQLLEAINFHDESEAVKIAVLEGLSASQSVSSIEVLVHLLSSGDTFQSEIINALTSKRDEKFIIALVEQFGKSENLIKDKIARTLTVMDKKCEEDLTVLLRSGIESSLLADIFTRAGLVEVFIRRLRHRKPQVRRVAARFLSRIATKSAFRGIVFAARDPDKGVRMEVVEALEFLISPPGEGILKSLEEEPEFGRQVRWTIDREKMNEEPARTT